MTALDLETYRRRAEEFTAALDREYYEHFSGRKPVCDTAAVYDRYPRVVHARGHRRARGHVRGRAVDDEKRRLAYLLAFTIDGFIGQQTRHLGDEMANTESQTHHRGRRREHRPAPGRRGAGQRAGPRAPRPHPGGAPGGHRGAPQSAARHASGGAATTSPWSWATPTTRSCTRRSRAWTTTSSAPSWRASCTTPRACTSAPWTGSVRERLGIPLAELRFADLPYLWRAPELRRRVHRRRTRRHPARHARRHGHRPRRAAQRAPRHRGPRAQVAARLLRAGARAGRDLPRRPAAGRTGRLRPLLHEAGTHRALRARRARISPSSTGILGDNAVTEGFAFTFDHLILNRRWLDDVPGVRRTCDDFLRFANVSDLYFMRRYAAKLSYEMQLHARRVSLGDMAAVYSAPASARRLMVDVPPESYLARRGRRLLLRPATCAPGCWRAPGA